MREKCIIFYVWNTYLACKRRTKKIFFAAAQRKNFLSFLQFFSIKRKKAHRKNLNMKIRRIRQMKMWMPHPYLNCMYNVEKLRKKNFFFHFHFEKNLCEFFSFADIWMCLICFILSPYPVQLISDEKKWQEKSLYQGGSPDRPDLSDCPIFFKFIFSVPGSKYAL